MLANAHHATVKHVHVLWDGDISQMALDAINNITAAERAKFVHVRIPPCRLSMRCRDWPVHTLDSDIVPYRSHPTKGAPDFMTLPSTSAVRIISHGLNALVDLCALFC